MSLLLIALSRRESSLLVADCNHLRSFADRVQPSATQESGLLSSIGRRGAKHIDNGVWYQFAIGNVSVATVIRVSQRELTSRMGWPDFPVGS